jgi:hypothetical protein
MGRPIGDSKMSQRTIDAVISLWTNPADKLTFTQIHNGLIAKRIVQKKEYRYKTARVLKRLSSKEIGLIQKIGGKYLLKVAPDEFQVFDYLQRIREIAKFDVGGTFWKQCEINLLGMPKSVSNYVDAQYALEIINIRIAQLFEALSILAKTVKKKTKEQNQGQLLGLPQFIMRELLLELFPYYLGSKAGIDFDGLTIEELNEILPKMIKVLPEEVTPQSATLKDIIKEYYQMLTKLMKNQKEDEEYEIDESLEKKPEDFALIVTLPEFSIDENGYEKRWLQSNLEDYSKENKSAIFIASSILTFKKEIIGSIMHFYGQKYLGAEKFKETIDLYEKMFTSNNIARIIESYPFYSPQEKTEAKIFLQETAKKNGVKNLIFYLPFSHCSTNYIIPTVKKEKHLEKFFSNVTMAQIHEWLTAGATLANNIAQEKWADLKEAVEKQDGV